MRKGFTLIEVIIVISFIGIVSSILIVRGISILNQSKIEATKQELSELKKAIMGDTKTGSRGFYGDIGSLPSSLSDLVNQGTYPSWNRFTERGWNGPYIQSSDYDKDAWGRQYQYNSSTGEIRSAGPDGVFNTGDDIFINLWQ